MTAYHRDHEGLGDESLDSSNLLAECGLCKSLDGEILTEAGTGRHVKVVVTQECCGSICNVCLEGRTQCPICG